METDRIQKVFNTLIEKVQFNILTFINKAKV